MQLKTLLNEVSRFKSFIFERVTLLKEGSRGVIEVELEPRANSRPICSGCGRGAACYDRRSKPRRFDFVPLWGFAVVFVYRMRRVSCRRCGIVTERVPWTEGKQTVTYAVSVWATHLEAWR